MAYKQEPGRGKSTPLKMAGEKMKSTKPIMMKGDLDKDGKMSSYESKRQAAIDKAMADEKSPVKMYGSPVKMEDDKGPLKMYKSPVKLNGGPGDGDDDDDEKKEQTIGNVTFTGEAFSSIFEKDLPTPGKRPKPRYIPKSHYSGISHEQREKNVQARVGAGTITPKQLATVQSNVDYEKQKEKERKARAAENNALRAAINASKKNK